VARRALGWLRVPWSPGSVGTVRDNAAIVVDANEHIPIARPSFGPRERELVDEVLQSGWVVQGPFVREFERRFEEYTGVRHAVATTSCTTALHLAIEILGAGPGDEVIVPAFTWVATPNAVVYAGATPRFCDVDLATFNIDVADVEGLVSERTVGIVAVHLFGLCAEMDALRKIAGAHGLWLLEDAACAFGASYRGRPAGTLGDAACFSFHPRKSVTTGEGGMFTTDRDDHAQLARSLRDHGASPTPQQRDEGPRPHVFPAFDELGFNYRMTDLQGALGCAQMERAGWILEQRRERAARYDELLADCDWLDKPVTPEGDLHGYQAYVCLFRPEEPSMANVDSLEARRNAIMDALADAGIATRPGTHAPVEAGYYIREHGLESVAFPRAHLAERLTIALPLYPDMTDDDQDRVCRELVQAFERV
jgi:perosamine synthetase